MTNPYQFVDQLPDDDPGLTAEWRDSLDALTATGGPAAARDTLYRTLGHAAATGLDIAPPTTTDYVNTIPAGLEPPMPGDEEMEKRIRHLVRWNAAVMVTRSNERFHGIGGHLATYASAATLYEVGFNHFFHGTTDTSFGDQIYLQGHASPGFYSRAFLEHRLDEHDLDHFRREAGGIADGSGLGLPSYPHPRRTDFWEFPTVSMGLGPLMAAYQARFNRYLHNRQIVDTSAAKVWCFVGDGEMDEPETTAALHLGGRLGLDNLIFVVNCNLQRLDGPVRGNGKIIQELEALYRGAGWNVIKVVWGREWDPLLAADTTGALVETMNDTLDGDFQKYQVESGAYIREHFFGHDPALIEMVAGMSDDDLRRLRRGGHDPHKVYAAYAAATGHRGAPTVILAKTVKGWSLGPSFEARNATHQMKTMTQTELQTFRDRLQLPITDQQLAEELPPYYRPEKSSDEYQYLAELGGHVPQRGTRTRPLTLPAGGPNARLLAGSGEQAITTTAAFTRTLKDLIRDPDIGRRIVPIIPDEARTFGIDALFRTAKIFSPEGQQYEAVDAGLLLSYVESTHGQILEEGITEAGSMASLIAAATAYSTWGEPMIPFFVYYSMFGFHRLGDLIWALGDMRGRGFMMAATAGRTTLQGEGLQHTDGDSLLWASSIPCMRAYDPAFAYELAAIIDDGIQRMYGPEPEDLIYYVTLYNEAYPMPAMPDGAAEGILRGLYKFRDGDASPAYHSQILASGPAMVAALEAQQILAEHYAVRADVWSATSYQQLRNDALSAERWNRLHPAAEPRVPYVKHLLDAVEGPIVAVSDYVAAVPDQIAKWVLLITLGTDGFGLSDTRDALRRHFEVDAGHIVVATLHGLYRQGTISADVVAKAIAQFGIDPEAPEPLLA